MLGGRPNAAFVTEAFICPRNPEIGKPVFLVHSIKNVHTVAQTVCSFSHYIPEDFIYGGGDTLVLRDSEGNFLPPAKSTTPYRPLDGFALSLQPLDRLCVPPGCAYRRVLRLDTRYALLRLANTRFLGLTVLFRFQHL